MKTAAQLAKQEQKKQRNIRLAQERLARLQELQRRANLGRQRGYRGTDEQIVAAMKLDERRSQANSWLMRVFQVRHYGGTVKRWLGPRVDRDPLEVQALVDSFLRREQNAKMASAIAAEVKQVGT